MPELMIVGRVRRAHGIQGEVAVEAFTNEPGVVFTPGRRLFVGDAAGVALPDAPAVQILRAREHKEGWLVTLDAIPDRTAAELWRGRHLLAAADELPAAADDEIYYHDLIGMAVELEDGTAVGPVTDLYELPQGLMLDVRTGRGSRLVPYRPEVVEGVDADRRVVRVIAAAVEGLLE